MPSDGIRATEVPTSGLQPDMEPGTPTKGSAQNGTTQKGTERVGVHDVVDSDVGVPVVSQEDVKDSRGGSNLGEASFLEEPTRTRESSLRRRYTPMDVPDTPTGENPTQVSFVILHVDYPTPSEC